MRNGLVGLASAMVLTTTMVIAGCNNSSSSNSGGTGGASSSSGGTVAKGGSTGSGGATGKGGSSGKGGQAGGAGAGGPVTTIGGGKTLDSLTADEAAQLCKDTYAYFGTGIPWSTICKWTGISCAMNSSAPTDALLRDYCKGPENACLQSSAGAITTPGRCSVISRCTATVDQYTACIRDEVASFIPLVDGLSACSALTSADKAAFYSVLSGDPPASCEALEDKCSGVYPPIPTDYTGATCSGWVLGSGGSDGAGGVTGSGGSAARGGTTGSGGTSAAGGAAGGRTGSGGRTSGDGGASGGAAAGGAPGSGGRTGNGGSTGAGGGTAGTPGGLPCDIYEAAKTPCVGAYSTVRALYGAYSGPLYQVRKTSDKSTKDIPLLAPGGFADSSVQDTFCGTGACTISLLYDQSSQKNDLPITGPVLWLKNGGTESDAKAAKATVGGHTVYGIKVVGGKGNGYRNAKPTGTAVKDEAEAMYEVASATDYNTWCCFDFGNAETTGNADGAGTMETIYWGANTQFGSGAGSGPWLMSDLEGGVFASDQKVTSSATPMIYPAFVTLMMKGFSGNRFALKGGDAQTGKLVIRWDGKRPAGYSPMKKQGAIILGMGGDGSPSGSGTWFEGAITFGCPDDPAVDDAIQANVVAAGYGK